MNGAGCQAAFREIRRATPASFFYHAELRERTVPNSCLVWHALSDRISHQDVKCAKLSPTSSASVLCVYSVVRILRGLQVGIRLQTQDSRLFRHEHDPESALLRAVAKNRIKGVFWRVTQSTVYCGPGPAWPLGAFAFSRCRVSRTMPSLKPISSSHC